MPAPKKPARARAKASRPEVHPLDEHLAALLNPALVEPKPQGFGEAPQPQIREPGAGEPSARHEPARAATIESLAKRCSSSATPTSATGRRGRRTGRRARTNPRAGGRSASCPNSSRRATSRRRSTNWSRACARSERDQVLLGVTGSGKTFTMAQGDRGDAAPGPDPRAEQDAGGAALRRVQELLPRQRGRVFRLLLRLLPAGGLRPAHRHLYREGIRDQRADRPHAPRGDARAAGARRRHHRRLGLLHLRHRLGRDLYGDDLLAEARRADRPAPAHRRSRRAAIQAHRSAISRAASSACAATPSSSFPAHYEDRAWRIGFFGDEIEIDRRIRSAHRQEDAGPRIRQDLRQFALRDAAPDAAAVDQGHQGGAEGPRSTSSTREGRLLEAQRLEQRTHVRSRNAGGDRLLRRHRELFALSHRPPARRAAADPVRISARQRARLHRREPRHRAADRRHVSRRLPAQGDARRIRLPPALLHGQPAAALRGMGRDAAADGACLGDAGRLGDGADRRRLRRAGHPPDRPHRSAGRDPPGAQRRSTTCSAR